METISVTIPREKEALRKTADYLRSLAGETAAQVTGGDAAPIVAQVTGPPIEVELNPEAEAAATGDHIDAMVATASRALIDSDGTPWDVRIHSGGKTFMASGPKVGTWKLKKGVDPALVEQVKVELSTPVETPAAVAPPVETPAAVAPPVETPAAVAPVVAPVAEVPVAITTYAQLIPRITAMANCTPPVLQAHDVMDALNASGAFIAGATNITELAKPEHIVYVPLVAAELEKLWATRV